MTIKDDINNINIESSRILVPPISLSMAVPMSPRAHETVKRGRQSIKKILKGDDDKLLVLLGPCSIHDADQALEYAHRVEALSQEVGDRLLLVMRTYFEKPRTAVGWTGFLTDPHLDGSYNIEDGLMQARKLLLEIAEMGVPTATEFLNSIAPQYIADLISYAAIGARTTESQTHREIASGLSMPVGFKNGTDGNIDIAMNAIWSSSVGHSFIGVDEYGNVTIFKTTGNPHGHLILRGGKTPNYGSSFVAAAGDKLENSKLPTRLVIDCSHGNSKYVAKNQEQVLRAIIEQTSAAASPHIAGVMIESHLKHGKQTIPSKLKGFDSSKLEWGLSITDECVGWEQTEKMIVEAHGRLK